MAERHLPDPIGRAMLARTAPERMQAVWQGLERRRARRAARDQALRRACAVAATVAVVFGAGYLTGRSERDAPAVALPAAPPTPAPLTLADGRALPPLFEDDERITFADGSQVELDQARVEVLANEPDQIVLALARGHARFAVRPGGPRAWWIEAGTATVRVVGTRFTVRRDDARVEVAVDEGVVTVRSERGVVPLRAGERLVLEPPLPPDEAPTAEPDTPAAVERRRPDHASWMRLAERGEYAQAWQELGARGVRERARDASAAELLALADVARRSGHPQDAVAPLERLLERYPDDPDAALGAFTLGRIQDGLGRPSRAADAFERALGLRLPASLRHDALARLARARRAAGDLARARSAAAQYLDERADGLQADAMRAILSAR